VFWELAVQVLGIQDFLLPSPTAIIEKIVEIPGRLLVHTWATLREVLIGFGIALFGGVFLAVNIFHSRTLSRTLYPVLVITQVVPTIAIAPVLTIWLGPTDTSRLWWYS
jgi:ABC-type nitrate/sulfonate/bicarbonate transport system permease component